MLRLKHSVTFQPKNLYHCGVFNYHQTMTKETFLNFISGQIGKNVGHSPLILLESQLSGHPANRYSIFGANPDIVVKAYGNNVTLSENESTITRRQNPWDALMDVRAVYPGWYMGYLGYDLKNHIEKLTSSNRDLTGAPDLLFFRPGLLLVYDHINEHLSIIRGEPDFHTHTSPHLPAAVSVEGLKSFTGGEDYLAKIEHAKGLIREGEFYEINISHALTGTLEGNGFDLYHKMKEKGPVPFASYLEWDGFSVCSASPERFLCRQGTRLFSQPIKGTAARFRNPARDEQVRQKLLYSDKNRAENLMIVDLVRHDLSRVSRPGTVRVPELFQLQSFDTVHQLISTVESKVDPHTDPVVILKSCFPMGSMTGAPKIRAMQAIEELEDYKRGIYSGAIGYIKPDHDFDFNVVIRSAVLQGKKLVYSVGGAITSDSEAEEELEETYIKAKALTEASNNRVVVK